MQPSKYQQAVYDFIVDPGGGSAVIEACAGGGKCLGRGTPVLRFDGTVVPVESVRIGDDLMGPDSRPRRVLSVSSGVGPLFEIVPVKGRPWVCNDVHVLTLAGTNRDKGRVIDMALDAFLDACKARPVFARNWKLLRVGVEFETTCGAALPIDPYFLGLWFGDGTKESRGGRGPVSVAVSKPDREVLETCEEQARLWGLKITTTYGSSGCPTYALSAGRGPTKGLGRNRNPLLSALRDLVGGAAHVPHCYLVAGRQDRLAFLAGWLDSDGYMHGGSFEIVQKRPDYANAVAFLARSLGFAVQESEKIVGGAVYRRLGISGDLSVVPTRLPRKRAAPRRQVKDVKVTGFQVRPLGPGLYFGFTLDGDGRFLLGDFTVTHNTSTVVHAAGLLPRGEPAVFLAFNKSIADELGERLPVQVSARTFHSQGMAAWRSYAEGRVNVDGDKVRRLIGDVLAQYPEKSDDWWALAKVQATARRLVSLAQSVGLVPKECAEQAPRGFVEDADEAWAALVDHHDVQCDDLPTAIALAREVLVRSIQDAFETGRISFDDMIYLPVVCGAPFKRYAWVFVDEAQDVSNLQREMLRGLLAEGGRLVAVGDKSQCQPLGTRVELTGGSSVPIEDLKAGDEVVTYHSNSSTFRGTKRQGRRVEQVLRREYTGDLIEVRTDGRVSRYTPEHRCLVRMKKADYWCLYLMTKGPKVRVGVARSFYACGFGPSARARAERADAVWVLGCYDTEHQARIAEVVTCARYGLPGMVFEQTSSQAPSQVRIDAVYEALPGLARRAACCLRAFGRDVRFPLWTREQISVVGKYSFITQACNLMSGYVSLREFDGSVHGGSWTLAKVDRVAHRGEVVSLKVQPTEGGLRLYVADGIVTHNSIYGWRGAASESIDLIAKEFGCRRLPLSISYRCPQAVVREAQKHVPAGHIEAHESAPEGIVLAVPAWSAADLKPKDAILCRNVAPLMAQCFRLIRAGVACWVRGRDVGAGLVSLVKAMRAGDSVERLRTKLEEHLGRESQRLLQAGKDEQAAGLEDRVLSILAVADNAGVKTVDALVGRIEALFKDAGRGVQLCTVHKAKGLEWERVWLLDRATRMPSRWARLPWQKQQEKNLIYTAITRAKSELRDVTSDGWRD